MLSVVYDFLALAELEEFPVNLQEFFPYMFKFIIAVVLVLAVFKMVTAIVSIFCNWRWLL